MLSGLSARVRSGTSVSRDPDLVDTTHSIWTSERRVPCGVESGSALSPEISGVERGLSLSRYVLRPQSFSALRASGDIGQL